MTDNKEHSLDELRIEVDFLWRIIDASQIAHLPQEKFNALIESLDTLTLAAKSPREAMLRETVTIRTKDRLLDMRQKG